MLEAVRKAINPPYDFKDLFVVFVLLFLLLILPIIALEAPKHIILTSSDSNTDSGGGQTLAVHFDNPAPDSTVDGIVNISIRAEANGPTQELEVLVDGKMFNLTKNPILQKNPLQVVFDLDSTDFENGVHQISAVAIGNRGVTARETIKLTFNNPLDTEAPSVSILAPSSGEKLGGKVKVNVVSSDNRAVAILQLLVDGNLLFSKLASSYIYSWDLSSLAAGNHTLMAKASDLAGNSSEKSI